MFNLAANQFSACSSWQFNLYTWQKIAAGNFKNWQIFSTLSLQKLNCGYTLICSNSASDFKPIHWSVSELLRPQKVLWEEQFEENEVNLESTYFGNNIANLLPQRNLHKNFFCFCSGIFELQLHENGIFFCPVKYTLACCAPWATEHTTICLDHEGLHFLYRNYRQATSFTIAPFVNNEICL